MDWIMSCIIVGSVRVGVWFFRATKESKNMSQDEDRCAICLEALSQGTTTAHPGCHHRLHVACLISSAQYDARCPVCRTVGDGVALRSPSPPTTTTVVVEWPDGTSSGPPGVEASSPWTTT